MTSYMNIMIRVLSEKARAQMARVRAETAALEKQTRAAAMTPLIGPRQTPALMKWGNQIQWAGRQLQYNFTLPLGIAAIAATKWQLENEKAFTRVQKVYGDTAAAAAYFMKQDASLNRQMAENKGAEVFRQELEALEEAFEALSNRYGVHQKEVIEIAGQWAAAGSSGVALAKSVELTMQAMILGELEAAQATEALIAIQAQYTLSTEKLAETLAYLNVVENQTGISMGGLIQGMARAAGVAREAGIDVRHLAAMMAALVPATGTASQAGNALKTIISRLMAPTKEASQVMEEMGLNITALEWQSSTAMERLMLMAREFNALDASAKNAASSVIASRWQINKFSVLMRELNPQLSYYEKALQATADRGAAFTQMQRELNAVLESNPKRLEIIWVMLQNAMADIIQPLIPYILYLTNAIKDLVVAFSNLDPSLQKFVVLGLAALALFPIFMRYVGTTATLIASLGLGFHWFARHLGLFGKHIRSANGEMIKARHGLLQFLKMLTITPLMAFGSSVLRVFGFLSGAIQTAFAVAFNRVGSIIVAATPAIVGSINALARAVFLGTFAKTMLTGLAAPFVALAGVITASMAASSGALMAGLLRLRIIQYAWLTTTLTAFRGWVFKVATIFTLLPGMLAGIMQSVWMVLTVPGAMTGVILRTWSTLALKIGAIWTALSNFLLRTWVLTQQGLAVIAASGGRLLLGVWAATLVRLRALWTATLAFLMSPRALMLVFARIGAVLAAAGPWLLRILTGPWGLAAAAITGILYYFRDEIAQIWQNILNYFSGEGQALVDLFNRMAEGVAAAFNWLPQSVQNALVAVATVVRDAALQIYEWFSYLNPFAQHSPSLVENVRNGLGVVKDEFASLDEVEGHLRSAYDAINRFGKATAGLKNRVAVTEQAQDRKTVAKFAPGALGAYDELTRLLPVLNRDLALMEARVKAQEAVVGRWEDKLEAANAALDRQQDKLDRLSDRLDHWQSKLSEAEQRLDDYANAPLEGMQAMEDRIFRNEMAQKRLRLEMLRMEQTYGTLDEIRGKIEAINGAQELLRGEQAALRAAGAGGEILDQYDKELEKLDKQEKKYERTADKLAEMQARLDRLQAQAEKLDLIKAMKFDELQRRIARAAGQMEEMSFEEIIAGIRKANRDIETYSQKVEQSTGKVNAQQQVVDRLTKRRDALQKNLDRENAKLDRIKEKYDAIAEAIREVESALSDVVSLSERASQAAEAGKKGAKGGSSEYVSPGLENFRRAMGGDFPDPGGMKLPIRTDWKSQVPEIEEFTRTLGQDTAKIFEDLNPFAPLKEKWNQVWEWIKTKTNQLVTGIGDFINAAFANVENPFSGLQKSGGGVVKFFRNFFGTIAKAAQAVWDLLGPELMDTIENVGQLLKDLWKEVGPELAKFGELIKPFGQALKNIWTILKPILGLILIAIGGIVKVVWSMLNGAMKPVFKAIVSIIKNFFKITRGIFRLIISILTLDLGGAVKALGEIFGGVFGMIWDVVKNAFKAVIGLVWGFVKGVVGFFKWLWDTLVGHSIIPDLMEKILWWFEWIIAPAEKVWKGLWKVISTAFKAIKVVWNNVIKPVFEKIKDRAEWLADKLLGFFGDIKDFVRKKLGPVFTWIWDKIKWAFDKIKDAAEAFKDRMIRGFKNIWDYIKDKLGPVFGWLWDKVKWAFDKIRDAVVTLKDRTIDGWKKIYDWLKDKLGPVFGWLWGKVKDAFENIKTKVVWLKDRMVEAFKTIKDWIEENLLPAFRSIKGVVEKAFTGVANVARVPINFVLDTVYNKGLKWLFDKVADAVGLDWKLPTAETIDKFASGGPVRGPGTGTSDSIDAKLSKGEHVWTAREVRNAGGHAAVAALRSVYGHGGTADQLQKNSAKAALAHGFDLGGAWDWVKDKAGAGKDEVLTNTLGGIRELALKTIQDLAGDYEIRSLKGIAVASAEELVKRLVDKAAEVGGVGGGMKGIPIGSMGGGVGARRWTLPPRPDDYSRTYFRGEPMNLRTMRGIIAAERLWGGWMAITQGSYQPATSYSGTTHTGGGVFDSVMYPVQGRAVSALRSIGFAAWDRTGMGDWAPHIHAVALGDRTLSSSAASQARDYLAGGDGLRRGGIIPHRPGGRFVRVGEGANDEAVMPLPNDWRNGGFGGGDTYNFYGDLSFPNVKNGEDAKTFLDNLENLAGAG